MFIRIILAFKTQPFKHTHSHTDTHTHTHTHRTHTHTHTHTLTPHTQTHTHTHTHTQSRWGRDFPPVQTGPGAHPAFYKMGTGSFPGVKCGRGVLLTTHPLLVPRSWKSRAISLPTLWATPGLWRERFTFTFTFTRAIRIFAFFVL